MKNKAIIMILMLLVLVTAGCTVDTAKQDTSNENIPDDTMTEDVKSNRFAVIETDRGTIKFELFEDGAPITTANFIKLAESGFYDGLTFHRVVKGFVAQGGDPKGDGTGGSDDMIQLEVSPELTHKKGAVGMARSMDPNSASSQFYFTLEAAHSLDGSYAVFGQVTEGMDVVETIAIGDKMNKVHISEN